MKEVPLRLITSGGLPWTGLTSNNIKFRKSPYGSGDVIGSIIVTEVGNQGNYICKGFTTWQLTKLFIDDVERTWWGEQFTGDPSNKFIARDGTCPPTAHIDWGGKRLYNVGDPASGGDVGDIDYNDARYVGLTGDQQIAGIKEFIGTLKSYLLQLQGGTVENVPYPQNSGDAANKYFVLEQVGQIQITPFQESPNVIRLIPGGILEMNKVYVTWATAMNAAKQYATANRRYTIEVKGAGLNGIHIPINNGQIQGLNPFESYISIKSENQLVNLDVQDGIDYIITLGTVIIENATIYFDDLGQGGTSLFNSFIFKDCVFDMPSVGEFEIVNGIFRGDNVFKVEGTLKLTNCRGNKVRSKYEPIVTGTYLIDYQVDPNIY